MIVLNVQLRFVWHTYHSSSNSRWHRCPYRICSTLVHPLMPSLGRGYCRRVYIQSTRTHNRHQCIRQMAWVGLPFPHNICTGILCNHSRTPCRTAKTSMPLQTTVFPCMRMEAILPVLQTPSGIPMLGIPIGPGRLRVAHLRARVQLVEIVHGTVPMRSGSANGMDLLIEGRIVIQHGHIVAEIETVEEIGTGKIEVEVVIGKAEVGVETGTIEGVVVIGIGKIEVVTVIGKGTIEIVTVAAAAGVVVIGMVTVEGAAVATALTAIAAGNGIVRVVTGIEVGNGTETTTIGQAQHCPSMMSTDDW
jgi:hypothetical protein